MARLVYLIAAIFALTVVATRGAALWREWQGAVARAEVGAQETARIVEQYARRVFETSDLVADLILREVAPKGSPAALRDDPSMHRFLVELSERTAGDYLSVLDADGSIISTNYSFPPPDRSFADQPWFEALRGGADRVVGNAMPSRLSDEILFSYTRALRGPDRALRAAVHVALRPTLFHDTGLSDDLQEGSVRGLWTEDGRPLARNGLRPAELGAGALPPPQIAFLPGHVGVTRATGPGDGRERFYAYRRLEEWGVVAAVGVPVDAALAPFRRNLAWSIGLLAAVLVALGGLTATARKLDEREQARRDNMAVANTRLRAGHDLLEASVAERTQALADANRRLGESEARYRGLFNASFQIVALLRPDGIMVEANDAALAFAGLQQEEIAGRPIWEAGWWDGAPGNETRLRDAVLRAAAGEFVRFEADVVGVGQTRTVIDFSLKPARDDDGRLNWLVAEGRDIGALKAAQAQLHEAQKLETLGQLTGGVAHDFNNLLMAILGNLHLLRKRLPPAEPRLSRLLDGAVQGAERGAALTQRLLAFARRQELRPVAINVAALTAGMRGLLERSTGPATRIVFDVPTHLPAIRADANQLEMALLNLALNARDAMPQGGTVRIEAQEDRAAPNFRPPELGEGRFVRLAVVDNGVGMDAMTLARATEPFFTTKGPGRGSGLGLSMVHGLAAQSGGRLSIRSEPAVGTTVELWLPIADDQPASAMIAPPAPTVASPVPGEPIRVLLVEDDPLIQAGTAAMLEDLGHRVVVAASGPAGLDALHGEPFDLVLTDYGMPGMTGGEFARRALALRPGLPIILATGFAELPEAEAGALPRLAKPYGQDALAAAIAAAVQPG